MLYCVPSSLMKKEKLFFYVTRSPCSYRLSLPVSNLLKPQLWILQIVYKYYLSCYKFSHCLISPQTTPFVHCRPHLHFQSLVHLQPSGFEVNAGFSGFVIVLAIVNHRVISQQNKAFEGFIRFSESTIKRKIQLTSNSLNIPTHHIRKEI